MKKEYFEIDENLGKMKLSNETAQGLLDLLIDAFTDILSPIADKQEYADITHEQKTDVVYSLLINQKALNALLFSMKHYLDDQEKKLNETSNFINNSKGGK